MFTRWNVVNSTLKLLKINNISFKISAGEKVGIVGRIGSGKTSIEKLILRLILCHLLFEDFDGVIYFLLKFYFNCLQRNKMQEGCENLKSFLIDDRFNKKLKTINVIKSFITNPFSIIYIMSDDNY